MKEVRGCGEAYSLGTEFIAGAVEHEEVVVMGYDVRCIHRSQFWPVARALDDRWVSGPVMQIRARCMEDGRFVRERIFRCSDVPVDRKEMPYVVMLN